MSPKPLSSDHLDSILADFDAAGIRPTALGIISVATDGGMADGEIQALCEVLATRPDLTGAAA